MNKNFDEVYKMKIVRSGKEREDEVYKMKIVRSGKERESKMHNYELKIERELI